MGAAAGALTRLGNWGLGQRFKAAPVWLTNDEGWCSRLTL